MKNLFEFQPTEQEEIMLPKEIIEYQCNELAIMTNQLILGKVNQYDEPISNYMTIGLEGISRSLSASFKSQPVDVQTKLGELQKSEFTYEFFLTSKYMPNFMYRIMFIRYGISVYPVQVVLDETIATQICVPSDHKYSNEEEFTGLLSLVLNSDKIKKVIGDLYNVNIKLSRQEKTEW